MAALPLHNPPSCAAAISALIRQRIWLCFWATIVFLDVKNTTQLPVSTGVLNNLINRRYTGNWPPSDVLQFATFQVLPRSGVMPKTAAASCPTDMAAREIQFPTHNITAQDRRFDIGVKPWRISTDLITA